MSRSTQEMNMFDVVESQVEEAIKEASDGEVEFHLNAITSDEDDE